MSWQQDAEREAAKQRWLEAQELEATRQSDAARAAGDIGAAKRHLQKAREYNQQVSDSIDRQADIIPLPKSGGSFCLLHVLLLPFHIAMAALRHWTQR